MWTLIRQYTVVPLGFPVDNIMPEYHRVVALNIIFSGCVVHTVPQVVNYAMEAIKILDNKPMWTFGDGFSTKQLLITGSALFLIFALMCITTLQRVRHTALGFRIFWYVHLAGILSAFPLLLIHGTNRGHPILAFFSIIPCGMYIADVIARRFIFVSCQAKVITWETHEDKGEKVTKLELLCSEFEYTPGQYAEIQIPAISTTEWHPFTIASAPSSKIPGRTVFYIKAVGRWTTALYDMVQETEKTAGRRKPAIHIRGPHGAPAQNYLAYRHLVVIGSGIGVTPLLSIWQHLAKEGSQLVCCLLYTSPSPRD